MSFGMCEETNTVAHKNDLEVSPRQLDVANKSCLGV